MTTETVPNRDLPPTDEEVVQPPIGDSNGPPLVQEMCVRDLSRKLMVTLHGGSTTW